MEISVEFLMYLSVKEEASSILLSLACVIAIILNNSSESERFKSSPLL